MSLKGSSRKVSGSGFTLVEIMIVVALMVAITTVAAFGLGVLGRADVNGAALKFSAAVRYTFNMSATSNKTLQMKLDFENRQFTVEELDLVGGLSDDELRGTTLSNQDSNTWRNEERAMKLDDEDTKFGKVQRTSVEDVFISGDDSQLEDGVYFLGLMTSHHDEIQTEGMGTINFFSNGFVERSVIYLGDEAAYESVSQGRLGEEGVVYTITISPLTGNSSVVGGYTEFGSSFFEEEEDD